MGKIKISNIELLEIIVKILIVGKVRKSQIRKLKDVEGIIKANEKINIEKQREWLNYKLAEKISMVTKEEQKRFSNSFFNQSKSIDINCYLGILYTQYCNASSYKERSRYPFYDGKVIGIFSRGKVYNLFKKGLRDEMKEVEKLLLKQNDIYTIGYLHKKYNYTGSDSKSYLIDFESNNEENMFYWKMKIRKEIQNNKDITFQQVMNVLIGGRGLSYNDYKGKIRWTKSRSFFYKYGLNYIFNGLREESEIERENKLKKLWY